MIAHRKAFRRSAHPAVAACLVALVAGCGEHVHTIPLLKTAGAPWTNTPRKDIPLEVVTRSTTVPDPLPIRGSDVAYADVEDALGLAVGSATFPWAKAHQPQRPEGWQLFVELVQAEAEYQDSRLKVNLTVRSTLRTRSENTYLGQKYSFCQQAALVEPSQGASVLYSCMARLGRDHAAWLGSIDP